MRVKKIHCLSCDKIIEVDFDNNQSYFECGWKNETSLSNQFRISTPGSIVRAIDKTKVKSQTLSDIEDLKLKKGNWFYLIVPENENTPKFSNWSGGYCNGFVEGVMVDFKTDIPMTFNACIIYLKTNMVTGEEGKIYHITSEI